MNEGKIKVGIIGLNPDGQWASRSHIPALKLLAGKFEITGVANTSYESAQKAAAAFQIPTAFENAIALIQSPETDVVVVTVKVPYHFELVKAALETGKHVYCEHPLGNGLEETKVLAKLAAEKKVVAVSGIQMVVAPEILYLRTLINEGYVGKLLSTTLIGSGGSWGNTTVSNNYYLSDKNKGATMLTIPMAHTLAGLTSVLGNFDTLSAYIKNNYTEVILTDTGEIKPKTSEDQVMVVGALKSGAAISVHFRGGISRASNLLWEINGSDGDIQITGPIGHGQLTNLTISGARGEEKQLKVLPLPPELLDGMPDNPMVRNVFQMYERLWEDIRNNTRTAPSFQDAVSLYELINKIELSAKNN